ncbi:NAD(P)/FAD-dependent oxidoreductase [Ancylobacter sp. SL191]|uniref:NAD(P)/FAD-dependent oxidoreductase n=1 Tax=Ancylobacter sp. SL191 TaxID=2995166 RepID=UPI002270CB60|nr:FAD/NAD(P)-binding oxidoreductase [Ancylobacter sp. SL191]WAC26533.1 FAD/NAD(P)-binding oxidoreductase [Ancylobacter sp. SL191]
MSDADVIIVGGGPAGVAAAVELRRAGIPRVMLLDREPELGGATRHCSHSPFGMREFGRVYLGAAYGRRLTAEAARAGVEVRTGHSVVRLQPGGRLDIATPDGIGTLDASRILIATGARERPRSSRLISGDRPVGVVTTGTLQAYVAFHGLMPFTRPLIIGSELVSLSAVLTCIGHGARPVALAESCPQPLARAPFAWFPRLAGVPFRLGTDLVDIRGAGRVEAATLRHADGRREEVACDGVLLTGRFTPESALFLQSPLGVDRGSAGPAVDQEGRTRDPFCFAAGNLLRAVETGGWSFREGRAIGRALVRDLLGAPCAEAPVAVSFDEPIKLVVPSLIRPGVREPALADFQLRVTRAVRGRLVLEIDGGEVWWARKLFLPERRILVPIPTSAFAASSIHFRLSEEG